LHIEKKVQNEGFSEGIEAVLGRALEATLDVGKERFNVEGVVGTVGDNECCEKDIVRGIYNKGGLQNNILMWMMPVVTGREGDEE
jgi:hypothetical protein